MRLYYLHHSPCNDSMYYFYKKTKAKVTMRVSLFFESLRPNLMMQLSLNTPYVPHESCPQEKI